MHDGNEHEHGFGLVLHRLCDVSAAIGTLLLLGIAGLTVVSVTGRAFFSSPVQGDVELVQLTVAVCVACFLPYTQFRGANIIVDFFTQKVSERTRSLLDGLGTGLYTLAMALIVWRVWAGGVSARNNQETSMLMAIPIFITYFSMLPGLALAVLVSAYQTVSHVRGFAAVEGVA